MKRASLDHAILLNSDERLMFSLIANKTGDTQLDGVATRAMEFELEQSPSLNLLSCDAYQTAARKLMSSATQPQTPELAREVASAAGAKAYLYGTLSSSGTGYLLSVEVLNANNNSKLLDVQETASSRDEIVQAVERIATRLRIGLVGDSGVQAGQSGDPDWRSDQPLTQEATANLEALHQYSLGEAALIDGKQTLALAAFQSAVVLDAHFVQAQTQISWLSRQRHKDADSATAARLANESASAAGPHTRLLAQFAFESNSTRDLSQADKTIRRFIALYPHDAEGALGLSRVAELQMNTAIQ
jgi:hypothetical protein